MSVDMTDISAHIREKVKAALAAGAALPHLSPNAHLEEQSVRFDAATRTQIDDLATRHGVSPGMIVARLIEGTRLILTGQGDHEERASIDLPPISYRREQVDLLLPLIPHLERGKIAFCEGGAGVGKSRVIMAAARHLLRKTGRTLPIIIAAPAIHNVMHLLSEWFAVAQELQEAGQLANDYRIAVVLGRRQFIDPASVAELLNEAGPDDFPKVRQWLQSGCPAGATPETERLKAIYPTLTGLAVDLVAIDPSFPASDCYLADHSAPEAQICWEDLRSAAFEAEVVFCTHAMLATDTLSRVRKRQPILPGRSTLFIDEAHQLEREFANVASDGLAFSTLRSFLRSLNWTTVSGNTAATAALSACDLAFRRLKTVPEDILLPNSFKNPSVAAAWPAIREALLELAAPLRKLYAKVKGNSGSSYKRAEQVLRSALYVLDITCGAFDGYDVSRISFSPERHWPSIDVGPRNVTGLLAALWSSTEAAALLSATLYLPNTSGPSANYIQFVLSVPELRCARIRPVEPEWLFTPTLILPAPTDRHLSPPTATAITDSSLTKWLAEISLIATEAANTAAGGTLLLMSGYDRLDTLAKMLASPLGDRLIVQNRTNSPLSVCRTRFVAAARRGERPVWIATGSAWTGLDLRDTLVPDVRASDDLVLTDLIIPNLPFGTARSTTHRGRIEFFGTQTEVQETALLFRQGIGRLIRRAGLQHRRLWLLDARVHQKDKSYITKFINPILKKYRARISVAAAIAHGRSTLPAAE